jgi:hypothetical protein
MVPVFGEGHPSMNNVVVTALQEGHTSSVPVFQRGVIPDVAAFDLEVHSSSFRFTLEIRVGPHISKARAFHEEGP